MNQKTKQIIIIIVIIVISFIGYKMFFVSSETGNTPLVSDKKVTTDFVDGQMTLALLNNLKKVTLDESVFSDEVFKSLVSFEKPIMPEPIGRQNPFLPIGR